MSFKPVKLKSVRRPIVNNFAYAIRDKNLTIRISKEVSDELKVKHLDLFSLFFDEEQNLFAIMADPKNKGGEASRIKRHTGKQSSTISWRCVDLLKEHFGDEDRSMTGLTEPKDLKKGVVVFFSPKAKSDK